MFDTLAFWNNPVAWVVLIIVLLLFGGAKIPEMMGGLAKGLKSFKNEMESNEDDELRREREKEEQREREIRARVEAEMQRDKEREEEIRREKERELDKGRLVK